MQICKKRNFFMKNMYATIFTFFHNLIYLKFIQNTSFSLTKFSLSKVKNLINSFINPFKNVSAHLLHIYVKCLLI